MGKIVDKGKNNVRPNCAGSLNTGGANVGNKNTGFNNFGDYNTGDYNSGRFNTGLYNSGDFNTGLFNTTMPKVRVFNKETNWDFFGIEYSRLVGIMKMLVNPACDASKIGHRIEIFDRLKSNAFISKDDFEFITSIDGYDKELFKECAGFYLEDVPTR